jgi:hypothetical protein
MYTGGQFEYYMDSFSIFYYRGLEVFRKPIINQITIGDSIIETGITYYYLVGKPCDSVYYKFDTDGSNYVKISADSLMNGYALGAWMLKKDDNRKKVAEVSLSKNITLNKYTMIKRIEPYPIDSVYFYYDRKVKPFCYSLAAPYDNSKKQKLVKLRIMHNQVGKSYDSSYLPKRERSLEIKEREVADNPSIDSVIRLYKMAVRSVS